MPKGDLQFKRLLFCIVISFSFTTVEAIAGFYTHSLALLSDAGHNLNDGLALMVTLFASWAMKRPISSKHTYGNYRAGIIAAFFNALMLVLIAVIICKEAWIRYFSPVVVHSDIIIVTAIIAFFVNAAIGRIIFSDPNRKSLNLKAALIHVSSDAIASLGVIIAGVVISFTGWYKADTLVSVLIAIFMLVTGFRILIQAINILMESTPKHLKIEHIVQCIKKFKPVKNLHDLHVWSVSDDMIFLTCHIELPAKLTLNEVHEIVMAIRNQLTHEFNIQHSTIQVEKYQKGKKYLHEDILCEMKKFD